MFLCRNFNLHVDTSNNSFSFIRDVKMGYRRLKEKVKEYKRRDAKLYGNMISKLSMLEDTEDNVSSSSTLAPPCPAIP